MSRESTQTTTLARLFGPNGRVHAQPRAAAPGVKLHVNWIPGDPGTEEEAILHDALTREGLHRFDDVKEYLADTLYWRDFLRGGWATDIAFLRHLYAREAHEIICRLQGVRLVIEEAR